MFTEIASREDHTVLEQVMDRLLTGAATANVAWGERPTAGSWTEDEFAVGLPGLLVPEHLGGGGGGVREAAVVLQAMGRHLHDERFLASSVLATTALTAVEASVAEPHLHGLAAGSLVATLAVGVSDDHPSNGSLTATYGQSGWRVDGYTALLLASSDVDLLVILARDRSDGAPVLLLTPLTAPGVACEEITTIDRSRRHVRIHLTEVVADVIATDQGADRAAGRTREVAMLAMAASDVGSARSALQRAVTYATQRFQFGRPIGSFQAVKHRCAQVAVDIALAIALLEQGVRSAEEGTASTATATQARRAAAAALASAAATNLHVHGGIGFTWENPAHRYTRRAKVTRFVHPATAADTPLDDLDRMGHEEPAS